MTNLTYFVYLCYILSWFLCVYLCERKQEIKIIFLYLPHLSFLIIDYCKPNLCLYAWEMLDSNSDTVIYVKENDVHFLCMSNVMS